jgi:hypothetical protein
LASNSGGVSGPNGIQLNGWQGINFLWWVNAFVVNESSDVDFADVMLYSSVLTTEQRNYVENSIKNYYGTGPVVTVSPTTTTTYYVAGSDSVTGCNSTANITVTVNSNPPTVHYATVNSTYFVDKPVLLTPTFTGSGNTYAIASALPPGININAATGVISGVPTVLSSNTTYTITVQNNCGSTSSQISFSTICNPEPPTISASSAAICMGPEGGVTFTASAEANYMWSTGETTQSIYVATPGSYTVTSGSSQCLRTSNPITIQNAIVPGDPATYGGNQWNIYAYNVGYYDTTSDLWSTNYAGYYTVPSLDFNTSHEWGGDYSPSAATAYVGCTVANNFYSWSAKRQGFSPAFYSIDIDAHDDRSDLWVNDTKVWEHTACCDSHSNVWQGVLGSSDKVVFRVAEEGGGSGGAISFHTNRQPLITASGMTAICQGSTVTLTAPIANAYLWSTSATTRSITVSTAGSYTVQVSGDGSVFSASSPPIVVTVNPVPALISITGNTSITCGSSATLTASGGDYYMWNPTNIQVPSTVVPLDQVPNATLAVGLRRLKSSYTGPCLRLRRTSDGAQRDFGFVGNDLDRNAITLWLAVSPTNEAQCMTLYDQSGNGGDVFNYNAIYDYFDTIPILKFDANGKPILHFNANQTLYNEYSNYYGPSYTAIYGANQTGGARERALSSYGNNWLLGYWKGLKGQAFYEGWVNNPNIPADDNFYIYSGTGNGTTSQIYENGTLLASNSGGVQGPNGIELNGSGGYGENSDVNFTDVMLFNSVLSATDRSYVENSIRNYYRYLSESSITVAPTAATTYTATGYIAATGCGTAASITVNPVSTITTQPSAPVICSLVGATTTVSVATNAPSASYVWQSRVVNTANPNPAWTNMVANANYLGVATSTLTITKTASAFATGTQYRVLVNTPCGQLISDAAPLTVITTVKAGTLTAPASVCLGSNITFTLSKYAGTSIKWQSAINAAATFFDIPGATGPVYTITGAMANIDKSYRAVVFSSCDNTSITTSLKTIKVDPASVAGTVTGGGIVCEGSSGTLKVAGSVGKLQWQYSTDNVNYVNAPKTADGQTVPFGTTSTSSTAASYIVTGIATALYFRAKVTSGTCSSVYTSPLHYTLDTAAVVGTISPASTTLCPLTGTTLTLSGAVGVVTWQKSTNYALASPTWISIANSNVLSISTGNMAYNTAYRAKVTIGSCSTVYSDIAYVYVVAKPLAKTITANLTSPTGKTAATALCALSNSKVLTVGAGTIGDIHWQWSSTSTTTGFVDIEGATGTSYAIFFPNYLNYTPTGGANYYRLRLTNSCGVEVFGTVFTVYFKACGGEGDGSNWTKTATPTFNVVAYPNPYSENFNLSLTTSSVDKVGVSIYDMMGKLLDKRNVRPSEVPELQIGNHYPSGVYNIVVTQGEEVKTVRIVKR